MKNGNYEYILLYSGQLSPIARLDADSRVVEEYVYGSRVNVPEYMIKGGRKYRFITDHRGSVRMVVDTHTGTVMQRTDYDEFGLIIDEDLAEGFQPVIFGYAGGLQDRDTGLIRFGARDYDPMVGRWTSKEPLGFNGSDNFYVYAENDPVNFVDVTGLAPGDYFKTMDAAAQDADAWVFRFDHSPDVEFGIEIYKTGIFNEESKVCEMFYSYSNVYEGTEHRFWVPTDPSRTVAVYHNHTYWGDDMMTDLDQNDAHRLNVTIYMGKENLNKIHKYTPIPNSKMGYFELIEPVWR